MPTLFCRECGARITDSYKFCFNCGTPVQPAPQPAPTEPAVVAPVAVPEISVLPVPPQPSEVPVFEAPAQPQIVEPAFPAEPVYAPPSEPSYVSVAYREPAEPAYNFPHYPSYEQPVTPVPSEPVYVAPAQPSFVYAPQPEPQPIPEPAAQPVEKKQKKQKKEKKPAEQKVSAPAGSLPRRSFLNIFSCVLICILMIALILPTVLLVDLRLTAEEDRVMSMLERLDLDEVPAADIFVDIEDDRTMLDWSCDVMNKNFSTVFQGSSYHWENIKPKSMENFLEDTSILEFTAKTVSGLLTDLIEDTKKTSVDASDIEDFLKDNNRFLEDEFELYLNRDSRTQIANQVLDFFKIDEISLDALDGPMAHFAEIATAALSLVTLVLMGVLVLLLLVLLFVANRKYIMAGIHDTGLVMLISGIVLLVLTGAARLMEVFFAGEVGVVYLIGIVAGTILESGLLISACIFAFGILLLLISGITLAILRKKAAKA